MNSIHNTASFKEAWMMRPRSVSHIEAMHCVSRSRFALVFSHQNFLFISCLLGSITHHLHLLIHWCSLFKHGWYFKRKKAMIFLNLYQKKYKCSAFNKPELRNNHPFHVFGNAVAALLFVYQSTEFINNTIFLMERWEGKGVFLFLLIFFSSLFVVVQSRCEY